MKTKIFYFSTSGNSLAYAKKIALTLGEVELISIAKINKQYKDFTILNEERIGFVFPVHAWGLPSIVIEFIKKLRLNNDQYLFAIATCGGTPAKAMIQFQKLVRTTGGELDAGFVIREGANLVSNTPKMATFLNKINKRTFLTGEQRLDEITAAIKNNETFKPEKCSFVVNTLGSLFYKLKTSMADKIKMMDVDFTIDVKCTKCKACVKICPNENIKMENNMPTWQHNCELCNACIQWCPNQAIHFKNETTRYKNPEVNAVDLFVR